MIDHSHKHPNRIDLNGNDTLPCVDTEAPEFTESQLFDAFTGPARARALELLGAKARTRVDCTHQYVNSLGQLTNHEERG